MKNAICRSQEKKGLKTLGKAIANDYKQNKTLIIIAIPMVLYYIIFHYIPMYGVLISFKDYNIVRGFFGSEWIGFRNFQEFFGSYYFARLLRNTVIISFGQLAVGFPAPIILALLINEVRQKYFKKTIQTITYMPHFISLVVLCGMVVEFFSHDGMVNDIITLFGSERLNFLLEPEYFRGIYIGSGVWQNVGWNSIIYIAALSRIDPQLYEACTIDGGGRWRQFLNVTIPQITPTIIIILILNIGKLMSHGPDKVILLYNPTTYETADIIASYVYRRGIINADYSFASAVGLFNNIINCMLLVITNSFSKKVSETSLW